MNKNKESNKDMENKNKEIIKKMENKCTHKISNGIKVLGICAAVVMTSSLVLGAVGLIELSKISNKETKLEKSLESLKNQSKSTDETIEKTLTKLETEKADDKETKDALALKADDKETKDALALKASKTEFSNLVLQIEESNSKIVELEKQKISVETEIKDAIAIVTKAKESAEKLKLEQSKLSNNIKMLEPLNELIKKADKDIENLNKELSSAISKIEFDLKNENDKINVWHSAINQMLRLNLKANKQETKDALDSKATKKALDDLYKVVENGDDIGIIAKAIKSVKDSLKNYVTSASVETLAKLDANGNIKSGKIKDALDSKATKDALDDLYKVVENGDDIGIIAKAIKSVKDSLKNYVTSASVETLAKLDANGNIKSGKIKDALDSKATKDALVAAKNKIQKLENDNAAFKDAINNLADDANLADLINAFKSIFTQES